MIDILPVLNISIQINKIIMLFAPKSKAKIFVSFQYKVNIPYKNKLKKDDLFYHFHY